MDPMPSDAKSAVLSNGFEVNAVEVGDMIPKLSAGSTSLDGCKGAMANSADRGELMAGSMSPEWVSAFNVVCRIGECLYPDSSLILSIGRT